jgi:hypothetical protein
MAYPIGPCGLSLMTTQLLSWKTALRQRDAMRISTCSPSRGSVRLGFGLRMGYRRSLWVEKRACGSSAAPSACHLASFLPPVDVGHGGSPFDGGAAAGFDEQRAPLLQFFVRELG